MSAGVHIRSKHDISNPHLLEEALEKVEMLEGTLNSFKAEMDMKMRILEQILSTRNEQVTVQKKLLDREQILYSSLLVHWRNAPNLVATGHSLNFNNVTDFSDKNEDYDDETDGFVGQDTVDDTFQSQDDDDNYTSRRPGLRRSKRCRKNESETLCFDEETNYSAESPRSEDEDSDGEVSSKRCRGPEFDYHARETYPNKEAAIEAIKLERKFWRSTSFRTKEGYKMCYHCRHDKKCSARIYLLLSDDKEEVTLFQSDRPHDHLTEVQVGIPLHIRERISELYSFGVKKPRLILRRLKEEGLSTPKTSQLANYLRTIRISGPPRRRRSKNTHDEAFQHHESSSLDVQNNGNESYEDTGENCIPDDEILKASNNPDSEVLGASVDVKLDLEKQVGLQSETLNDEQDETGNRIKKSRRPRSEYDKVASFSTAEEAHAYVRSMKEWILKSKFDSAEGLKVYYLCRDMQSKCPARVHVLSEPHKSEVDVYQSTEPHNHERKRPPGLSDEVKEKIKGYFAQGIISAIKVLGELKKDGFIASKEATLQVTNWVAQYRRKHGLVGQGNEKRGRAKRVNDTVIESGETSTDAETAHLEQHEEPAYEMPRPSTSYAYHQYQFPSSAFGGLPPIPMAPVRQPHPGFPYHR